MAIFVDTNVMIHILTDDPNWADWSQATLESHSNESLSINPAIFAELCYGLESLEEAEAIVRQFALDYLETPRDGLFRAAKAFAQYKMRGGSKDFVLPDFFIGGHAESSSMAIITRDRARYSTYFPGVQLIGP